MKPTPYSASFHVIAHQTERGMTGGGPGKDPSSHSLRRWEATGQEVIVVLLGDVGGLDGGS